MLGSSAKVLGGCSAGGLFGDDTNPVGALVIGILATVLVQSSSTTTSIIVSLVGAGAVGVHTGIYMVMGANIGTSVTNTIVSMGQMADGPQLERAFAGATVHDMFNLLSVAVLFPIEVITGYLYHLTKAMLPDSVADGDKWEGPIKKIVSPFAARVITANKDVIKDIALGKVESCDAYYPVLCLDGIEDYNHCASKCDKDAGEVKGVDCGHVGTITCDKKVGCPAFFQDGATQKDDNVAGGVCLFLSLVLLILCLIGLVNVLQRGLNGMSTRVIYKATNVNGLIAIAIGAGITVLVQSSSITTSVLTPLVGLGVIQLEQMVSCCEIAAFQLDSMFFSRFIWFSFLSHLELTLAPPLLDSLHLWCLTVLMPCKWLSVICSSTSLVSELNLVLSVCILHANNTSQSLVCSQE